MTFRRFLRFPPFLTFLVLGMLVSLSVGRAHAHDVRLDEAVAALQKAEALLKASAADGVSPKVERKFDRRVERALDLIQRAMDRIEEAGEIVDDALGL
jgi:hypothetical protein